MKETILLADIGGTHARFALARDQRMLGEVMVLKGQDYPNLASAAQFFLQSLEQNTRPHRGIFAVAAPLTGDRVSLTNLQWDFSIQNLCQDLGLQHLDVVNDFTAIAWAIPRLKQADRVQVGGGTPLKNAPIAILGPGSGLGISALIPIEDGWKVLPTESGHVTLSAMTHEEDMVLEKIRARFGHVSAERVLSGPGLVNLYVALSEISEMPTLPVSPKDISSTVSLNPMARKTMDMFYAFLGTVASNVALNYDAQGGIYLAGGIINKLGEDFLSSDFRHRFECKGRFSDYVSRMPTYCVTHPFPAFCGLEKGPLTCGQKN